MHYLPIEALQHGYVYQIEGLYANYGVWDKSKNAFVVSRWKFKRNSLYLDYHCDFEVKSGLEEMFGAENKIKVFGSATPIEMIEKFPFSLKPREAYSDKEAKEILSYLDGLDKTLKGAVHKSFSEIQADLRARRCNTKNKV